MSYPQKQLLGEPLVFKPPALPATIPYTAELLPQHLTVVVSQC